MQPVPKGKRFSVLTHMGGPGTMCIDEISELGGIEMPALADETQAALKKFIANGGTVLVCKMCMENVIKL